MRSSWPVALLELDRTLGLAVKSVQASDSFDSPVGRVLPFTKRSKGCGRCILIFSLERSFGGFVFMDCFIYQVLYKARELFAFNLATIAERVELMSSANSMETGG